MGQEYSGIMGGADSFTIIGVSGIGKSAAISRAMSVISENVIIEMQDPYSQIIPFVTVQCPFDSSVKGMLLEILRKIDEVLDTKYYQNALRARATTDMLIGSVSQTALHHVGMLVVDEIQNIVTNKNGKSLIGSLTQLINNTGISVCMVGTPESSRFFGLAMQLARRSVGLQYSTMSYDDHFKLFCKTILGYQYLRKRIEVNDGILEWLYEHSSGVTSVVVALLHDAQEIAILNGVEELILPVLNEAYDKRLALLHGYIQPDITPLPQTSKCRKVQQKVFLKNETVQNEGFRISDTVKNAKANGIDIIQLLLTQITVEVIPI